MRYFLSIFATVIITRVLSHFDDEVFDVFNLNHDWSLNIIKIIIFCIIFCACTKINDYIFPAKKSPTE
jgi:hypothetical protein